MDELVQRILSGVDDKTAVKIQKVVDDYNKEQTQEQEVPESFAGV